MKIAIRANNGKYISAEQGGGLVYSDIGTKPLYANRDEIGPWETFELEYINGYITIKTCNGYYWTAELGGGQGISTNRMEAWAWEQFYFNDSGEQASFKTINGVNIVCAELGGDSHLNATRINVGPWESFNVEYLDKVVIPPIDAIRTWKGNLTPYLGWDLPYGPNGVFWTPGYVAYDESTRKRIRDAYRGMGFTHLPMNLTNHSTIYRDFYPHWDDSLINTYLTELLKDEIIPVGYTMGDQDTTVNCKADPSLVPIALGKWEDPTPLKKPAMDSDNRFYLVKEKYPNSVIYWHNPPYQGAPYVDYADWGLPEGDSGINAKVWHFMVDECKVQGLMFQGQAWNNDAQDSINSLGDFALRLGTGHHGWPIADLVDYEETAYYLFNMGGNQEQALAWTKKIRNTVSPLNGFCNG